MVISFRASFRLHGAGGARQRRKLAITPASNISEDVRRRLLVDRQYDAARALRDIGIDGRADQRRR